MKFKVLINWQGEVLEFWTTTDVQSKALSNAISQLAKKVGMRRGFVKLYVTDPGKRRWEVVR